MISSIEDLPPEIARRRVVKFSVGCDLIGKSPRHARRLIEAGKLPKPVKIGDRSEGFILGDLLDAIDRAKAA